MCQAPDAEQQCSRCKLTFYCSPFCQRGDWADHKRACVQSASRGRVQIAMAQTAAERTGAERVAGFATKAFATGEALPRRQIFDGVTNIPRAMKPVIGLASDVYPWRGLSKAPYIAGSSLIGVVGFLVLGLFPSLQKPPPSPHTSPPAL